jgi:preprotein translocase subunit SecY
MNENTSLTICISTLIVAIAVCVVTALVVYKQREQTKIDAGMEQTIDGAGRIIWVSPKEKD